MKPSIGHRVDVGDSLTLWSFRRYGGDLSFRYARPNNESVNPLGWEVFPDVTAHAFEWASLVQITAEGIVTLAAAVDALSQCAVVTLKGLPPSLEEAIRSPHTAKDIAQGIQFLRLVTDSLIILPHKLQLDSSDDCSVYASIFADTLANVARGDTSGESIRESIELSLLEILYNAFEHGQKGFALIAAVVQPGRCWSQSQLDVTERRWLQYNATSLVIEFAVADVGPGVPACLERSYVAEFADTITDIRNLAPASRELKELRRELHTSICEWAFAHYSTSKHLHISDAARNESLNWRGLHRAWGYVNWHDGMIALSSGQARVGFAAGPQATERIRYKQVSTKPLPGTVVTVRYGKRFPTRSRGRAVDEAPSTNDAEALTAVLVDRQRRFLQLGRASSSPRSELAKETSAGRVKPILHLFREGWLQNDRSRDLEELRRLPPDVVAVHYFTDATEERLGSLLAEDYWSRVTGSPRLIGAWTPKTGLLWAIAGRMPAGSAKWVREFVSGRVSRLPDDGSLVATVRELATHFPGRIIIDGDYVRLSDDSAKLSFGWISRYASNALSQSSDVESAIFESRPGQCVLLSDGTRVSRYFSLTALLSRNGTLREIVAFLFGRQLELLRKQHGDFVLVTPTLASYYLARLLLRVGNRTEPDVYLIGNRPEGTKAAVVFQTATRTGRTLSDAVRRSGRATRAAIVGVDLGLGLSQTKELARLPSIRSLLRYDFDPKPDPSPSRSTPERVMCNVTDWPVKVDEPSDILASAEAVAIVERVPYLFSVGLQAIDSRAHVVTLPGDRVVANAEDELLGWVTRETIEQVERSGALHILLVCRPETPLFALLPQVAARLYAWSGGEVTVERLALTAVQHSGRSVVYGHITSDVTNLREDLRPQGSLLRPAAPAADYCAVYLDAAAVTGKNFRSVVNLLRSIDPMPRSLLFLPITNRLSPREEIFIRSVQIRNTGRGRPADVRFASIFRLQVGSYEHLQVAPAARLFSELDRDDVQGRHDIAVYLAKVRTRLNSVSHDVNTGRRSAAAIAHLYTPDDDQLATDISLQVVKFRHLLALYHQNRPVLTELLTLFHQLKESGDAGLLTVLALEPDLLRQPPLLLEGYEDIQQLARDILSNSDRTCDLSDAMVVAGSDLETCLRNLREMIEAVARRPELGSLLLVLAARLVRSSPLAAQQLIRTIEDLPERARGFSIELASIVRARAEFFWPSAFAAAGDLVMPIHRLISLLYSHSPAHTCWRNADQFFTMQPLPFAPELPSGIGDALRVAAMLIVPAVQGVIESARLLDDLDAAQELEAAAFVTNEAIDQLARVADLPSSAERDITAQNAWLALRAQTFTASPEGFLGKLNLPEANTGVLERALRKFYCLPLELTLDRLHDLGLSGDVTGDPTPLFAEFTPLRRIGGGQYVLALGVAVVQTLVDILVENAITHGVPGTLRVGYRERDTPSGLSLELIFRNVVGPKVDSGNRGLLLLRTLCERHRLPPLISRREGDWWGAYLQLWPCAFVQWDSETSNAILHH